MDLKFPFSLFALKAGRRYDLIDRGALKLVENLDKLKNDNNNFREDCLVYSIPSILLLIGCIGGLSKVSNAQEAMPYFTLITLTLITSIICWRFGNKLLKMKGLH